MYKSNISKSFGRWTHAAFALLAAISLSLAGCGGGGGGYSSGSPTDSNNGQAIVSLTDAAGDFLAYTVDVVSLTLTEQDGTVVSTLPLKSRVDFTQLADLTELLTGATVPAGNYKSIGMRLDYTNADIRVDDGTGTGFSAAAVKDRNGNALTTLDVSVDLDGNHPLVIAPGLPSQLALDFNLAASNEVDITVPTAPVVTVDPVLSASLSFDQSKPHRVRGRLISVDTSAGAFTLNLRPFHLKQGSFGEVSVTTGADTVFEIDQVDYQGSAGLNQLAGKPSATATVAVVTPNGSGQLVASEVYAGSSVSFGSLDVVTGNVTKRIAGDLLEVHGAKLVQTDGTLSFNDTVLVKLGFTTKVTGQTLVGANLDIDSISVGQRITALGVWNTNTHTLDTTIPSKGLVRMMLTQLNGSAVTVSAPLLSMSVNRIDGRPSGLFDFTGTGTPIAVASNYAVKVPNGISLSGITSGTPLKVRGFVRPFGFTTATDDFDASTVIDVSAGPANLVVQWPLAGQIGNPVTPFGAYTSTGVMVEMSRAGLIHDVYRSGVDTSLAKSVTPTVNAQNPAQGLFIISYHGTVQVYIKLSDFQSAVQNGLAAGQLARSFAAHGTYDDASTTMTATEMFLLLK